MTDTPIQLFGSSGEPLGRLRLGALALAAEAEDLARSQGLSKRTALPLVLREHLVSAGYELDEISLRAAVAELERVRRGETLPAIAIPVRRPGKRAESRDLGAFPAAMEGRKPESMTPKNTAKVLQFFEAERTYPDETARAWYERLVGLDEHKERLLVELEMLLYPERLERWSRKHHGGRVLHLLELQRNRIPLVVLEGDVGTGKTALAETIGDALARSSAGRVHLLKINTQVRGTGLVGEMSDLIAQAFAQAEAHAAALEGEPVLILLDEADALAGSRDTQQMHHEDKAGLNTLLQRLDNLRLTRLPLAAIFITNRPDALDPAIRRRAALDLHFDRPDHQLRAQIIRDAVPELALDAPLIDEIVRLTGPAEAKNCGIGFTASDLTDRLLPAAVRAAYRANRALMAADLLEQAQALAATPQMGRS